MGMGGSNLFLAGGTQVYSAYAFSKLGELIFSSYSGVGSLGGSQQFRFPELLAVPLDNR